MSDKFIYLRYTKNNTPETHYCKLCRSGFLSLHVKKNHVCRKTRYIKGRYRCVNCNFESERRVTIQHHTDLCRVDRNLEKIQITEREMTSENTDQIRLCPLCSRGFSMHNMNYRFNHITECQKNPNRKHQKTTEYECRFCGKLFLLKTSAISHVHAIHRNNNIRGGTEQAEKKQSMFRYASKNISLHLTDLNDNEIIEIMYNESYELIREKCEEDSLKAYPIFRYDVVKNKDEPDERYFSMYFSVETAIMSSGGYRSILAHWVTKSLAKFDESQHLGSNTKLIELHSVDIMLYQFTARIGKGNESLPSVFYHHNKIIRIINSPKNSIDCFHACLCAAHHVYTKREESQNPFVKATTKRLRNIPGKNTLIDYTSLDFTVFKEIARFMPMTLENISKIEKYIKPFSLNVFELQKGKAKHNNPSGMGYSLIPIFVSKLHGTDVRLVINILYYKEHFYLINKLNALIEKMRGIRIPYSQICYNCLQGFDSRYTNIQLHLQHCLLGIKSEISYGKEGEEKSFTRFEMTILKPYFAFCDFESSMLEVSSDKKKVGEKTTCLKRHSVNSVCAILYIEDNLFHFPYSEFKTLQYYYDQVLDDTESETERLITNFVIHLKKCSSLFEMWSLSIDSDKQRENLKHTNSDMFHSTTKCMFCKSNFSSPETGIKCFHHDHHRNKYIGACCLKCNLKAEKTHILDVYFHNISYDANFILDNLNFKASGETKEWKASLRGQKVQLMCSNSIRFRDSFSLLPLALAKLGKMLKPEHCKYQKEYLPFADTGKYIFPYNYISSIKKFDETAFPPLSEFKANLGEPITKEVHETASLFFRKHFTTLGQWNKYYITKDCLVGIDVLIHMREFLYNLTCLDLLGAYSLPDLALNSLLLYVLGNQKLEIITNPNIYNSFLDGCRGGISWASLRHHHIDESRKLQDHLFYFDLKSSYPYAFTFPLPISGWKYIELNTPDKLTSYLHQMDTSNEGLLVRIDCVSPPETHDWLNDLPIIIAKTSFSSEYYPNKRDYKHTSKAERLIGHLGPVENYTCTSQELALMLSLGVIILKVHSVIRYDMTPFASDLVSALSLERQKAIEKGNLALSFIIKILLNSLFGKTLLNKLKYNSTHIVFNSAQLEKRVASTRFMRASVQKYSALTVSHQKRVKLDSLVHIGCTILAISKTVLISYYYSLKSYIETITYIMPKPKFRGMYFDTDSCIILITNVERNIMYNILKSNFSHIFDFSTLPSDHPLYSEENKYKIGILKFETKHLLIQEVNALGSKVYNINFFSGQLNEKGEEITRDLNKCKGVPESISSRFTSNDFRTSTSHYCIENSNINLSLSTDVILFAVEPKLHKTPDNICFGVEQTIRQSRKTYTYCINKRILNPYDRKRFIILQGIDSLAINHFRIPEYKE